MGQTLTHGIYLPDEGERNCYDGLASNWSILDGAVGTVAEHSTQIAGKAPAVHTHTKSDITDFPVYGNAAGTICEGNDSRLSDARTPVAHTHGKTDITDLFNSANVWSGNNTYSVSINYKSSYTLGNLPANAAAQQAFKILESTGTDFICDIGSFQNTLATGLRFTTRNKMDENGFSPSGTIKAAYLYFLQNAENKGYLQWDGYTKNNVIPLTTNTYELGTSTAKWKTLNGINPGALSLPDIFDSYDVVTSNWNTAYDQPNNLLINGANPSYPGWLFIRLDNCTAENDFLIVRYYHFNNANITFYGTFLPTDSSYVLTVPIQAGIITKVWVSKFPTYCKYHACLGTVK